MYNFNIYKIFYHYSIMAKENTLRIFPIHFKRANIFAPIKIQSYTLNVLINIYIFLNVNLNIEKLNQIVFI